MRMTQESKIFILEHLNEEKKKIENIVKPIICFQYKYIYFTNLKGCVKRKAFCFKHQFQQISVQLKFFLVFFIQSSISESLSEEVLVLCPYFLLKLKTICCTRKNHQVSVIPGLILGYKGDQVSFKTTTLLSSQER